MKYNKIWISKIIESEKPFLIRNPILSSILKVSLILDVYFAIFYLARNQYITANFLLAYLLALLWMNLGPFFIWYYEEQLLPNFFLRAIDLIPNYKKLSKLRNKSQRLFSKKFWIITIPWTFILLYIYGRSGFGFLRGGIFGKNDIFYWLGFIGIIWMGLLTSIGFWGVLTTLFVIKEISKENLKINPLHFDRHGGLGCVGYYAIGTTGLFASGSLFLPSVFQFVYANKTILPYVYFAVILFSVFILLSFLYPTIKAYQRASLIRRGILNKLRKKYVQINRTFNTNIQNQLEKAMIPYLELYRIRTMYLDYSSINLYPFEMEIFIKLVTSTIFPFIFLLIQTYWIK